MKEMVLDGGVAVSEPLCHDRCFQARLGFPAFVPVCKEGTESNSNTTENTSNNQQKAAKQ